MAEVADLLQQLQAAAAARGPAWLQEQVSHILTDVQTTQQHGPARARRSRPPERFSPGRSAASGAQRRVRSPSRDPPGPPPKRPHALSGGRPGRNPRPRRSPRESGPSPAPISPPSRLPVTQDRAATSPGEAPVGEVARRGSSSAASAGRCFGPAGGSAPHPSPVSASLRSLRSRAIQQAASPGEAPVREAARRGTRSAAGSGAHLRAAGGPAPFRAAEAGMSAVRSVPAVNARRSQRSRASTGPSSSAVGDVTGAAAAGSPAVPVLCSGLEPWRADLSSEGEVSASEEENPEGNAALAAGSAAAGDLPRQPGESHFPSSGLSVAGEFVSGRHREAVLGASSGGQLAECSSGSPSVLPAASGDSPGGSAVVQDLLSGFRALLDRLTAGSAGSAPVVAWSQQTSPGRQGCTVLTVAEAGVGAPLAPQVASDLPALAGGAEDSAPPRMVVDRESPGQVTGAEKGKDTVRIADSARCEVYVCFEGPLGSHLKPEIRDKIWKGEYVEIFSLLPLEKFNLDRVKPEESKKEDEEKRRYRLIPRTFANWLQAFAIMASVIGEKEPEHCSALFCYLDAIGEAHRVYGGVAWLRYDEQFRQRKAVRPSIRWDHKDISLWMKLMTSARSTGSFFPGAAGSFGTPKQPAARKLGFCWQFNEGHCRFGSGCRYKHECSGCGGNHASSKCFRQGKGRGTDATGKREDSSEGGKDASFSK